MLLEDMSWPLGQRRKQELSQAQEVKCLDARMAGLFQNMLLESHLILSFHKEILSTLPVGIISSLNSLFSLFNVTQLTFNKVSCESFITSFLALSTRL